MSADPDDVPWLARKLFGKTETEETRRGEEREVVKPAPLKIVGVGVLAIVVLILGFSSWYTVGKGEAGVEFHQAHGAEESDKGEGFHLKYPWPVEYAEQINMKTQKMVVEADAASHDLQQVTVTMALRFHPEDGKAWYVWSEIDGDYRDTLIDPAIRESIKSTTAQYRAEEIIQKRPQVREGIKAMITEKLENENIRFVDMEIQNIEFSDEFWRSIEDKVVAEQEAQKQKNLEIAAQHEANQSIARAQGQAEAARIISEQLSVSPRYLTYFALENWNGVLPQTYVDSSGGGNGTGGITDILVPVPNGDMGPETGFNVNSTAEIGMTAGDVSS